MESQNKVWELPTTNINLFPLPLAKWRWLEDRRQCRNPWVGIIVSQISLSVYTGHQDPLCSCPCITCISTKIWKWQALKTQISQSYNLDEVSVFDNHKFWWVHEFAIFTNKFFFGKHLNIHYHKKQCLSGWTHLNSVSFSETAIFTFQWSFW